MIIHHALTLSQQQHHHISYFLSMTGRTQSSPALPPQFATTLLALGIVIIEVHYKSTDLCPGSIHLMESARVTHSLVELSYASAPS